MLVTWRKPLRNCPHRKDNIKEATIVDDVARTIPGIYATLED